MRDAPFVKSRSVWTFAVVRHSLKKPPQPGIIVSPAGMYLATAVSGTRVTSAGKIPGIPGGNSSPAYNMAAAAVFRRYYLLNGVNVLHEN